MKFIGGYTYRFIKAGGASEDYVFAGDNGSDTLWRTTDNKFESSCNVFNGVVEIKEIARPDRASNELR